MNQAALALEAQNDIAEWMGAALVRPHGVVHLSFTAGWHRHRGQLGHQFERRGKLIAHLGLKLECRPIAKHELNRLLDVEGKARRQLAPGADIDRSRDRRRVAPTQRRQKKEVQHARQPSARNEYGQEPERRAQR